MPPESYYGLGIYWAKKIYKSLPKEAKERVGFDRLIVEGLEGLVEANTSYDPDRGVKFTTFATPRVRGRIIDYLRSQDPLTQRERQKVKELDRAKEKLIRILGREPSTGELAQDLGISEEEVREREALRALGKTIILSLEDLTQSDKGTGEQTMREISSAHPGPEEELLKKGLAKDVGDCLEDALRDSQK